ncbi:MAG: hypothetical protein CVU05_11315 [Bacteroidetes bacterium HGW-Bacteroidetes-21]|jgi:regulator of cell morphogenesis and NO signaling|nr:MAG: hypothetical protein CVU05_11315 [Bacteroidetes bacterium HGW-Bacteroidetes-21]
MLPESVHYINKDSELSSVLMKYPVSVLFIEHFGIHLPLSTKTIKEICEEYKINPELFLTLLYIYIDDSRSSIPVLGTSDVPQIIFYLKNCHNYYLQEIYPEILDLIKTIHSNKNTPEISLIKKFFEDYFNEVKEHLDYENDVVFPYMTLLYDCILKNKKCNPASGFSVTEYKTHHDDIEEKITDLLNLLIKYLPADADQKARRKLFSSLTNLDHDLKIHTKIENLVLIPMVEEMEKQLG